LWDAVHIENQYLRLMILPQLGGRIHVGRDKTNGYDFFYRQDVIKPALVGLAGPWISGGVEFNWPQHHRPSTFMPTEVSIEQHADGSVTVWCSEHEPMSRMKGMHGICLHPGKALIELKARLYNRTPLVQTFLWWANVAARVHERYQSFFPPDVCYVADHAKRAISRFPLCESLYYGVDYGDRGRNGVPADQSPRLFVPPGNYPANDLSWYANIPVPTSYMAMGSREQFFGGYDHTAQAGLIHVANRHVSPGKKQWTWGNHDFGYAWDRNLTDADENGECPPYVELMAGVYTDNQPDFSYLHPGETRTFSQYWYPVRTIGPARQANVEAAISLHVRNGIARIGVAVSSKLDEAIVRLDAGDATLRETRIDLAPDRPLVEEITLPAGTRESDLHVSVHSKDGHQIIEYTPIAAKNNSISDPAVEPALPPDVPSNEQLYLIGLHLQQYRHATRMPEDYWLEALRRDASDSRCNNTMGLRHLRRGQFESAADHFRRSIQTLTRLNPNPPDGEPFYNLGLALRFLGRDQDAYDAFYKSTWNFAWQSPAFFALAELDCRQENWTAALEHLDRVLRVNADYLQARDLRAIVLRKLNRDAESNQLLHQTLALDPLDVWAQLLTGRVLSCDAQTKLDVALDFSRAGLFREAVDLLSGIAPEPGVTPLVAYYLGWLHDQLHQPETAASARAAAVAADSDYCFPARLEEIAILRCAIDANPADARAPYYLGNLFYDRRRHGDAIELWQESSRLDPTFPTAWRNLGIAYFNVRNDADKARDAYDKAFRADPSDARLLFERDQLWKRTAASPKRRLAELEKFPALVRQRDDLSIELCALYNQTDQPERALELLKSRRFQPWEGGEGLVLGQHVRTHLALGQRAMRNGNAAEARRCFEAALDVPANLGEARHLLANQSDIHFFLGSACDASGAAHAAQRHWTIAAQARGDFQEMSVRAFSEMTYFSALALQALGRAREANQLLRDLLDFAADLANRPAKIDYFATSLPTMLLFDDDLQRRLRIHARLLEAQARLALGEENLAVALLRDVLNQDPSHAMAAQLLASTGLSSPLPASAG